MDLSNFTISDFLLTGRKWNDVMKAIDLIESYNFPHDVSYTFQLGKDEVIVYRYKDGVGEQYILADSEGGEFSRLDNTIWAIRKLKELWKLQTSSNENK